MSGKKHLTVFVAAFSLILGPLFTTTPLFAASKEKVLYSFGPHSGVLGPTHGLSFDAFGNLYSTTYQGGPHGYGTVWELTHKTGGGWSERILYSFLGESHGDGAFPDAGVVVDAAGNLYGTTYQGGFNGAGTVFELTHKRDVEKCSTASARSVVALTGVIPKEVCSETKWAISTAPPRAAAPPAMERCSS